MSSANPEDDILYQWRLKRRMEQAQQKVHKAEQDAKYTSYQRNKAQLSAGHGYRTRFDVCLSQYIYLTINWNAQPL